MKSILNCLIIIAFVFCAPFALRAQRPFGVGKLVIDDGSGHSITLQAPPSMTTSYNYLLPTPPAGSTNAGFVDLGTATGQTLYWNGTAWVPSVLMINTNSNVGLGFASIPGSFPFPVTTHTSIGPDADNTLNLGDATHRFNTIYASNIIGPIGFTNYWQRVGTTVSPATAGDVIAGNGSGLTNLNPANLSTPVAIANGGTGQTTAAAALNALLPTQGGNNGKVLMTNGTTSSWQAVSGTGTVTSVDVSGGTTGLTTSGGPVTTSGTITLSGTLGVANGGTGLTSSGSAGQVLRSNGTSWTSSGIQASDVPTLNQNTTGTASNVTGTVAIANGGTGQISQQSAINALAGAVTNAKFLRGDGANVTMSSIQASDVPTLNQNTTGSAANVTGTVAIANGGTGQTTASAALNALLPAQTGNSGKVLTTNGTTSSWQAVSGTGTVTSVDVSGGSTGLTTSGGPITGNGTISFAGTVNETHGGTNQTTYTTGDILYASNTNTLSKLAIGSIGQVLTVVSGAPSWQTAGGSSNPMTTLGDITYEDNTPAAARLAGNTTTTKKFLTQTGTGSVSAAPAWGTISASDVPTLNQNTTGTAANVTGTVAIANGGTGQTSQQNAINALAGAVTTAKFLRGDGTNVTMASIQTSDVPTLNQNTTGTASNVTGTVAIANGGTGQTSQQNAINALAGDVTNAKFLRGDGTNVTMASIQASDVPILNQSTTGTASNVTGTVAIANGGTGQTSQQNAINALAGAVTNAKFLRGDGTNVTMASIQAADVPTLNQNTTGTSANVTGVVAIANGGTNSSTALNNGNVMVSSGGKIVENSAGSANQLLHGDLSWSAVHLNNADVTGVLTVPNGGTGTTTASANTVFSGPTTGAATAPAFRVLVAADIPSLSSSYINNSSSQQSSANFNIDGSGTIGSGLTAIGNTTAVTVQPSSNNTASGLQFNSRSSNAAISNVGQIQGALPTDGPANSRLAFNIINTNGVGYTEAMSIKSGANVGIGTTNPATTLDVNGIANAAAGFRIANAAASGSYLRGNGTNFVSSGIQAADVPDLSATYIKNSSSLQSGSNFNISGSGLIGGSVGIGTTSPQTYLHIWNTTGLNANGQEALRISSSYSSGTPGSGGFIRFTDLSNGAVGEIHSVHESSAAHVGLGFWTLNGAMQESMRILSTGKVGIGTTSPSDNLEVVGSSNVLRLTNSAASTQEWDFGFDAAATGANHGNLITQSPWDAWNIYLNTDNNVIAGGAVGFRIFANGAIGSASQLFEVKGTGIANATTGFEVGGGAASGAYLRGDGTNFVSSAIQSADIPDLSATYIKNSSSLQSGSNFNISGNGYIGGNLGIGTTSPGAQLHVSSSANSEQNVFLQNSSAGAGALSAYRVGESMTSDSKYLELAYFNSGFSTPPGSYATANGAAIVTASSATSGMVLATNANAPIKFVTNGGAANNERMRIDGGGNVGIGTTSPGNFVDAVNTANTGTIVSVSNANTGNAAYSEFRMANSANQGIMFYNGTGYTAWGGASSLNIANGASAPIAFFTNGNNERLRIDGSGNVGIGTTSPARSLEVDNAGSGTTWPQLRLANTGDYLSGLSLTRSGSSTEWIVGRYGSAGNDNFDIGVNTVADYFQITPSGNVGINTASPSQKLQVANGNLFLSNSGTAGQLQLQGTSSGVSTIAAGAQGSTTLNYILPTAQPTANQVLTASSVSGSGPYSVALGWSTASGGSSPSFARRTTDTGYASTTPGNDNTLLIALASNATYVFDAFLVCSDSNASGINGKLAFTVPSGAALRWGVNSSGGSFATNPSAATSGTISPVVLENANPGDQNFVLVKGIVVTGSTSGNLQLQCGITSQGSGKFMRVYTNSYIVATRVQ